MKVQADVGTKKLKRRLQNFWEVEALGIIDREEHVYEQFTQHISFCDGRYEVSLRWREPLIKIPTNYDLCFKCLMALHRKLWQDEETFMAYNMVIQEQLQKGIVEIVKQPERPQ